MSIAPCSSSESKNIIVREEGSLDEEERAIKVEKVALKFLQQEIEVPIQLLKEKSKYFDRALSSSFKEKVESQFDFRHLNEEFPHLEKAMEVLFLENKDIDSLTTKQLWEIVDVAKYLGCEQLVETEKFVTVLKDRVLKESPSCGKLKESIDILFNLVFDKYPLGYETIEKNIEQMNIYVGKTDQLRNDTHYVSLYKLINFFANFIFKKLQDNNEDERYYNCYTTQLIMQHLGVPHDDEKKFHEDYRTVKMYLSLGQLYSNLGFREGALNCFKRIRPIHEKCRPMLEMLYDNIMLKLIECFCCKSILFSTDDILECIDILHSEFFKAKAIEYFIVSFKGHTVDSLQEVANRLDHLKLMPIELEVRFPALEALKKAKESLT